MPIDYKDYSDDWKRLSKQIIKDAGNKCELCFARNYSIVGRKAKNYQHPWEYIDILEDHGYYDFKETKIVLTVHHIDGNIKNNTKFNLIALCQRCHLKLDMAKHVANRKKNKSKIHTFLEI